MVPHRHIPIAIATNKPTSKLVSEIPDFRDFAYSVDFAAKNRAKMSVVEWAKANVHVTADLQPYQRSAVESLSTTVNVHAKGETEDTLNDRLLESFGRVKQQLADLLEKPTTPDDVMFVTGDDGQISMFAVPHGRRMGIYFETEAAMRAFSNRLDDTGLSPLPRYAMPEPISDRIEMEHGLPLIVADAATWRAITTRYSHVIDYWLNSPEPRRFWNTVIGEPWRPAGGRS